ncbi:MAG: glycosyltransferase family 2 protein [Rickettsiaceae bacterium]
MINVVIPMAGLGARFIDKGYGKPKPFIIIDGKMMIERVLDGLRLEGANYYLIIQEQFLSNNSDALRKIKSLFEVKFITVKEVTQGAACTALAAHKFINNDAAVLFADCDNIFFNDSVQLFVKNACDRNLEGSLLTFKSTDNRYSYAEIDIDSYVTRTREKVVISSNAIAGVYYFAKGSFFVDSAIDMMIYKGLTNGEYYMSNVYNHAILRGLKIGIFEISMDNWACVGTPEQLGVYLGSQSM